MTGKDWRIIGFTVCFCLLGGTVLVRSSKPKNRKHKEGKPKKRNTKRKLKKAAKRLDMSVFDSPDLPGSGECMDPKLVSMLLELESSTGYKVFENINSAARSPIQNKAVGGVSNSSHLIPHCLAVDIHAPGRTLQKRLVTAAKQIGFTRIGIGNSFIHLDVDDRKAQYVAWGYPKGAGPPFKVFP